MFLSFAEDCAIVLEYLGIRKKRTSPWDLQGHTSFGEAYDFHSLQYHYTLYRRSG
jgi:hypothetical protein